MQLEQLAQEKQLLKLTIDAENIVEKYGEALDFWVWDRQSLDTFAKMIYMIRISCKWGLN